MAPVMAIRESHSAIRDPRSGMRSADCGVRIFCGYLLLVALVATWASAQELPALTQPVNDFANVIDPASAQAMESLIRSLHEQTQDAVVVATVDTYAPYGDIREFANRLFENHGKGIGQRGK